MITVSIRKTEELLGCSTILSLSRFVLFALLLRVTFAHRYTVRHKESKASKYFGFVKSMLSYAKAPVSFIEAYNPVNVNSIC